MNQFPGGIVDPVPLVQTCASSSRQEWLLSNLSIFVFDDNIKHRVARHSSCYTNQQVHLHIHVAHHRSVRNIPLYLSFRYQLSEWCALVREREEINERFCKLHRSTCNQI